MHNNQFSIVLPNYNGKLLLEKNLPSLYEALTTYEFHFEIIVVDDASTDDSVSFLRLKYPDIIVLNNEVNSGFSVTCNKGIQHAQYNLVCVANTDVTFHKDYFFYAEKHFKDPAVFGVKGDIINYEGYKDRITNIDKKAYLYFSQGFLRFKASYKKKENFRYDIEYMYLGCCFIAKTTHIQKLGGFDTIFSPYYWEDSDLPLRAIEQGFTLIYEPKSIVYHDASSTMKSTQSALKRKTISNRNKFLFCWKHLKGKERWAQHIIFVLVSLLLRWIILDWRYYQAFFLALKRRMSMSGAQSR